MSETSRIVAVIDRPVGIGELLKLTRSLEAIYGEGLTISNGQWTRFEIRTPGPACWCMTCEDRDAATVNGLTGDTLATLSRTFIVCPECGNKRCPKATHHDHDCTGSNEPGQTGSIWGDFDIHAPTNLANPTTTEESR